MATSSKGSIKKKASKLKKTSALKKNPASTIHLNAKNNSETKVTSNPKIESASSLANDTASKSASKAATKLVSKPVPVSELTSKVTSKSESKLTSKPISKPVSKIISKKVKPSAKEKSQKSLKPQRTEKLRKNSASSKVEVFEPEVLVQKAITPARAQPEVRRISKSLPEAKTKTRTDILVVKDKFKADETGQENSDGVDDLDEAGDDSDETLAGLKTVEPEILDEAFEIPVVKLKEDYSHLPSTVTDGLSLYLSELRKYPLLTKEQEVEVAQRYALHHDPKDAEILVTSNLRFVVKVAAEYARFGSRLIDLIQEGNVGLMHAVKEFNPYKGVRLITYAVWWIRGYIQEYLMRQYSMVRIGTTQNQRKLFYRLDKEREKLTHEGLEITPKLLSARLGVTEDEVNSMQQRLHGRDISLDQPLDDDSTGSLLDFEAGTDEDLGDQLAHRQSIKLLHSTLEELRPSLNEKEKQLLDFRLLNDEPKKLQEIGDQWGVTREAVRQMEVRLMKKIKTHFEKLGQNLTKAIEDE